MREFLQLSLRLMVFTLVAGLLLALTNAVTEGPIKAQQQMQEDASRYAVFPDADGFELIDDASLIEKYPSLTAVYKALKGDSVIGYTLNYAPAGYKSTIGLTIGVSSDGAITGVIVDSQSETQGVGSKITEESFLGQFTGKAASSTGLESEIDTITGATVSSSTVKKAVQSAATVTETELGVTPNAAMPMDPEDEFRLNTMPGASGFESVDLLSFLGEYDTIRAIKTAYSGSEKIGYSFDLVVAGFGGDINLTLGIATDGTITGLQVGENSESEGYGKAIEQPEYTAQYAGISADTASLDAIDGISGATVTSTAVMRAVRQAVAFYDEYLSTPELPTLDDADEFVDITSRMAGSEADYPLIVKVEQALTGGEVAGYRFTTASYDGYNSQAPIELSVDVVEGRIAAINVLSQQESDGIGTRAFESDYLNKFLGDFIAPTDGVDTLAGATFTSSAVKASIDQCAAFYSAYISGEEAAA